MDCIACFSKFGWTYLYNSADVYKTLSSSSSSSESEEEEEKEINILPTQHFALEQLLN